MFNSYINVSKVRIRFDPQAEDRAHRIGQSSTVKIKYLLAHDSVDNLLWPLVNDKFKLLGEHTYMDVVYLSVFVNVACIDSFEILSMVVWLRNLQIGLQCCFVRPFITGEIVEGVTDQMFYAVEEGKENIEDGTDNSSNSSSSSSNINGTAKRKFTTSSSTAFVKEESILSGET